MEIDEDSIGLFANQNFQTNDSHFEYPFDENMQFYDSYQIGQYQGPIEDLPPQEYVDDNMQDYDVQNSLSI